MASVSPGSEDLSSRVSVSSSVNKLGPLQVWPQIKALNLNIINPSGCLAYIEHVHYVDTVH